MNKSDNRCKKRYSDVSLRFPTLGQARAERVFELTTSHTRATIPPPT